MTSTTKPAPTPVTGVNDEATRLKAEMEALKAENETLKKTAAARKNSGKAINFKVGGSGAVVVTGLSSRYGCTLYTEDHITMMKSQRALAEFLLANINRVSFGDDKDPESVKDVRRQNAIADLKAILGR